MGKLFICEKQINPAPSSRLLMNNIRFKCAPPLREAIKIVPVTAPMPAKLLI